MLVKIKNDDFLLIGTVIKFKGHVYNMNILFFKWNVTQKYVYSPFKTNQKFQLKNYI